MSFDLTVIDRFEAHVARKIVFPPLVINQNTHWIGFRLSGTLAQTCFFGSSGPQTCQFQPNQGYFALITPWKTISLSIWANLAPLTSNTGGAPAVIR